jgi:NAD(P)-dependent dehydrogenase (short-subunit alcohol dehydrogenase family)
MSGIGRRAIIIGASSGMGAALAENLAARVVAKSPSWPAANRNFRA